MSLRRLNDEARAKIRSSIMINNVCGCVRELVYNSLDAGATQITVKLDISKYFVQVIDNGCGINHEDMIVLGGQSFTSKYQDSISSMGFRGEALFSICELTGRVEVCSRHQLSTETWSKLFHHGRDLGVTRSTSHRKSVGTTVTLHDMFFKIPVRRKCIKEPLEVEHIRQMVQETALVNPHISVLVENNTTGITIVKSKKVQSISERISCLYSHSIAKSMKQLDHRAGSCHVSGYISSELSSSKSLQLVYINKRLVCHNQIHTLLDNLLICSKTRTERLYPQYIITIQCLPMNCDFCYQHSKTYVEFVDWPAMLKAVAGAVNNVVSTTTMCSDVEGVNSENYTNSNDDVGSCEVTSIHFSHGMKSKRVQKTATVKNDTLSISSFSSNSLVDDVNIHKFIGVKTVSRSPLHTSSIAQKLTQFSDNGKSTPEYAGNTSFKVPKYPISDMLISPFIPLDHSTPLQTSDTNDSYNTHSNSSTTNKYVKSQEYHSTARKVPKPLLAAPHLSHDVTPFVSGKRLSLSLPGHIDHSDTNQLSHSTSVEKLLSEWNNPVFRTGQEHIMTTSQCYAAPTRTIYHHQFTKQMFHNIRVINQVDSKFIACLMDTKCNGRHDLLVLVDQHAAHERIRLEQLTAELYTEEMYGNNLSGRQIHASVIEPGIKLHRDQNMLSAMTTFHVQLKAAGIDFSQVNGLVTVNKLPALLVNNKLPIVSAAAIEGMIREHVEHLSNTGGASNTIPRVLTDVLATQACHGAIKFNDPLTLSECQELMESLSQCKLPFQCAHGRPSLIPLLDLNKML